MRKKILIMAGGTGGHVFPGLAVARYLSNREWEIRWLGTRERMESRLVPEYGFDISYISVSGVRRNGILRKLYAPFMIIKAIWQANRIIREYKPDVVLGMGGYASGPGGIAAWLNRIPVILHEQNAAAGFTNRALSHFSSRICMGFAGAFQCENAVVVGNPVREEISAISDFPIETVEDGRTLRILVVGGSLGASFFNERFPGVFAKLDNVEIKHQTGRGNFESTRKRYEELGVLPRVEVLEFISDMADAYIWADVIICRAGALTVAEVSAAHKPAIFVPLPTAVDDHQTKNAESLQSVGAAFILQQKDFNDEALTELIVKLDKDRELLSDMARKSRDAAILDATEKVAAICEEAAEN